MPRRQKSSRFSSAAADGVCHEPASRSRLWNSPDRAPARFFPGRRLHLGHRHRSQRGDLQRAQGAGARSAPVPEPDRLVRSGRATSTGAGASRSRIPTTWTSGSRARASRRSVSSIRTRLQPRRSRTGADPRPAGHGGRTRGLGNSRLRTDGCSPMRRSSRNSGWRSCRMACGSDASTAIPRSSGQTIRLDSRGLRGHRRHAARFRSPHGLDRRGEDRALDPAPAPGWGRNSHWALATGRLKPAYPLAQRRGRDQGHRRPEPEGIPGHECPDPRSGSHRSCWR